MPLPVIDLATPAALFVLLALLPVVALLVRAARRRRLADDAYGGAPLLRLGLSGRRRRIRSALLLASLVMIAVGIARPRWGTTDVPLTSSGIDVAIALDVSRSMTATDIEPSRAAVAAAGLQRMLAAMQGDRVGLVTFGGTAFGRSPLTLDLDVVAQLVGQAQGEALLVRPGTNLGVALQEALALLIVDDAAETQVIVLVSDGEDLGTTLRFAVERAQARGIRVYTVAAGTEEGGAVLVDAGGATEISRLDRAVLAQVAAATGGELRELENVAGLAVEFSHLRQSQFAEADQPVPQERFQWLLGVALALLLAQSWIADASRVVAADRRRREAIVLASASVLALLMVACGGSEAHRAVEDGNAAYAAADYERALAEYRRAAEAQPDDPVIDYNAGNTLHQLRRFEEASVASQQAMRGATDRMLLQQATYALASHAFRRGALEDARDAFVAVLRSDPEDDDARHNLELVLLALNPPPENPGGEHPAGSGDGAGEAQSPGDGGDPGPGDSGGSGESSANGTPAPGEDGAGAGSTGPGAPPGDATAGPGDPGPATGDAPSGGAATLADARAELEAALAELGPEITLDEALRVLELLRRVNALDSLEDTAPGPGRLPDR